MLPLLLSKLIFISNGASLLSNLVCVFSEVNSEIIYKSAAEREKLVKAERAFTDSKVQKIIDLKRQVCDASGDGKKKGFIVINMKVSASLRIDFIHVKLICMFL